MQVESEVTRRTVKEVEDLVDFVRHKTERKMRRNLSLSCRWNLKPYNQRRFSHLHYSLFTHLSAFATPRYLIPISGCNNVSEINLVSRTDSSDLASRIFIDKGRCASFALAIVCYAHQCAMLFPHKLEACLTRIDVLCLAVGT